VFFTYLGRELRQRPKQAIVVALGLALGIGLVVTVSAASAGVKTAQGRVLHSLYGVGTDVSVTQTATAGTGGPTRFGFGGGTPGSGTRPAAGTHFSRNTLSPTPGTATFSSSTVASISKLSGVSAATGGLELNDTSFSGTFGSFGFGGGGGSSSAPSGTAPPFSISSFSVAGVQPTSTGVGPLTASEVIAGRYFTSTDTTDAILSASYATQQKLKVGSTITVAGKKLTVVGVADMPSGSTTDVFIPLAEAQSLAGLAGKVSTVYVSAKSASDVSALQNQIHKMLPKATITTASDLANEVTGSLASASSLATKLGKWLAIAALLAAFLIAALLMIGAVTRRVREFGTLKALGWRTRRVVGQVLGEGLAQGIAGGVLGIGLGFAGSALVAGFAGTLSATVGQPASTSGGFGGGSAFGGGGFGGGSSPFGGGTRPGFTRPSLTHTVLVHMSAPVQTSSLGLAIGLAIAGGIIAGSFGAWRAARLGPAAALRKVG
jgi:putative ABC transport system permease protein